MNDNHKSNDCQTCGNTSECYWRNTETNILERVTEARYNELRNIAKGLEIMNSERYW